MANSNLSVETVNVLQQFLRTGKNVEVNSSGSYSITDAIFGLSENTAGQYTAEELAAFADVGAVQDAISRVASELESHINSDGAASLGFINVSTKAHVTVSSDNSVSLNTFITSKDSITYYDKPLVVPSSRRSDFISGVNASAPPSPTSYIPYQDVQDRAVSNFSAYSTKPKISLAARRYREIVMKQHYFSVLTYASKVSTISSILVVGCGFNPVVDINRLALSGLCTVDANGKKRSITMIDPDLVVDKQYCTSKEVNFKFFGGTFADYVFQNPDDKYDLVVFPFSFHAICTTPNFFSHLKSVTDLTSWIVGMVPHPAMYADPLFAASLGQRVVCQDHGHFFVTDVYTGRTFKDPNVDYELVMKQAYVNGFALQLGTGSNIDLFKTPDRGLFSEGWLTLTMAQVSPHPFTSDLTKIYGIPYVGGKFGLYDYYAPNHGQWLTPSSIMRILGRQVYYSNKIDGVQCLVQVSAKYIRVDLPSGNCVSFGEFDASERFVVLQCEAIIQRKCIQQIFIIDVVSDITHRSLRRSCVDLGDASFVWRVIKIHDYAKRFKVLPQAYYRNIHEIPLIGEGIVVTPMFSSRVIRKNNKRIGFGSGYIKSGGETDFCIPVVIQHGSNKINTALEFYFTEEGNIEFKRARPGKKNATSFPKLTLLMKEFLDFVVLSENYTASARDMLKRSKLSEGSLSELTSRVIHWANIMIGNIDPYALFPIDSIHVISELNHAVGTDTCSVCASYNVFLKTGIWKHGSKFRPSGQSMRIIPGVAYGFSDDGDVTKKEFDWQLIYDMGIAPSFEPIVTNDNQNVVLSTACVVTPLVKSTP